MGLFSRKQKRAVTASPSTLAWFLAGSGGALPTGYHRLLDSPEVGAAINRMTAVISSATIYLMRNTSKGDERVKNRLSRFVT